MRNTGIRSMGKYSYAIYVFHYPIVLALSQSLRLLFTNFWMQNISMVLVGVALSWIAALVSWNLIERRMMALKNRLYPV
jgi:peptidoglycan/LPS O-acetylase OafA/YrhL